jgi:hypothetical protein
MQLLLGFIIIFGILLGMVGICLVVVLGFVVLIGYTVRRFRSGQQKKQD